MLNSQNGATVTSVNDTVGTPYLLAINADGSTGFGAIYYGIAAASGANTVTIVYASTVSTTVLGLHEFSGNAASSPLDKTAEVHQTVASTSYTTPNTATTSSANELLVGFFTQTSGTTLGSGWSGLANPGGSGDILEYQLGVAIGSYAATASGSLDAYNGMIATFLPAAGGTVTMHNVTMASKAGVTATDSKLSKSLFADVLNAKSGLTQDKMSALVNSTFSARAGISSDKIFAILKDTAAITAGMFTAKMSAILKETVLARAGLTSIPLTNGNLQVNFSPKSGMTSARLFAAIKDTLLVKGALSPTLLVAVSDKMLIVGGLNNLTLVVLLSDNISTKEGLTLLGLSGGSDVISVVLGAIDYITVLSEY